LNNKQKEQTPLTGLPNPCLQTTSMNERKEKEYHSQRKAKTVSPSLLILTAI
jgi:hypothetical protein